MNGKPTGILTPFGKRALLIIGIIITLIALIVLAMSDTTPAHAEEPVGPACHTTQAAKTICDADKHVVIQWQAGNYMDKTMWLHIWSDPNIATVTLANNQTQSGTFTYQVKTLPAGTVEFVWSDGQTSRTETVTYPAKSCEPTAVTLSTFSAISSGNRSGCAPANKLRALACVITDFQPGKVAGTCDGGYWFKSVPTARTFRLDTPVTVQGCIGEGLRLVGVAGWPLRISR